MSQSMNAGARGENRSPYGGKGSPEAMSRRRQQQRRTNQSVNYKKPNIHRNYSPVRNYIKQVRNNEETLPLISQYYHTTVQRGDEGQTISDTMSNNSESFSAATGQK